MSTLTGIASKLQAVEMKKLKELRRELDYCLANESGENLIPLTTIYIENSTRHQDPKIEFIHIEREVKELFILSDDYQERNDLTILKSKFEQFLQIIDPKWKDTKKMGYEKAIQAIIL